MNPAHVAIIMDGNGRWAQARGLPRAAGHRAGVEALRAAVEAAGKHGISWLTLYAFSSENWSRPVAEVSELMTILRMFIRRDLNELHRKNVRVRIIGRRDGLEADIASLLSDAERQTEGNTGLNLVIAFNYSGRDEIARAMQRIAAEALAGKLSPSDISPALVDGFLDTAGIPDPDLVIRTSGEQRLSNFLLWQSAYAELVFLPCHWPDFRQAEFAAALEIFARRNRRFGGLDPVAASGYA